MTLYNVEFANWCAADKLTLEIESESKMYVQTTQKRTMHSCMIEKLHEKMHQAKKLKRLCMVIVE